MRRFAFVLVPLLLVACDPGPTVTPMDSGRPRVDSGTPPECPPGQSFCNGRCIPTDTNPLHCGGCGNVCESDETCEGGTCRGTVSCPSGQRDCGGGCTEVATNNDHCGRCGNPCGDGESCLAGSCEPDTCPAEEPMRCDDGCTNTATDNANCGACGTKCAPDELCTASACASACDAGNISCDVDGSTVCIDSMTNAEHCGGCDQPCADGQTCVGGACSCPSDTTTCGAVCVNTDTDPAHCGGCTRTCEAGQACNGGACGCTGGLTLCGTSCVNTAIANAHCGACDNACAGGQNCLGSSCVSAGGCTGTQVMCGGSCRDVATDAANCGMCGNACGAGTSCRAGVCRPANDERANAIALTLPAAGSELEVLGSTTGASPDLPSLSCDANGPNVWYSVTLPTRGVLWIDTAVSDYDTAIFVANSSGTQVAGFCNDDCGCGGTGDFGFLDSCDAGMLAAGTYFISVGGYSTAASGDFLLHVQFLPDVGFTYSTRLNGIGTTTMTTLVDPNESTGTCGGPATANSGEDQRWFASCGSDAPHHFSTCPEDGGSWTEAGSVAGQTHDPVLYVRSALTGTETACNDDDFSVNCRPVGGGPRFGSRVRDHRAARGVHGVFVDSRGTAGSGMMYQMRYELPELGL